MKWQKLKDKKPPINKKLILYERGVYVIAEKFFNEGWFRIILNEKQLRITDTPDSMLWLELPEPPK